MIIHKKQNYYVRMGGWGFRHRRSVSFKKCSSSKYFMVPSEGTPQKISPKAQFMRGESNLLFRNTTSVKLIFKKEWCPRKESNLHFGLRKPTFYPLNYEDLFKIFNE